MSRAELARYTGAGPSTISGVVGMLVRGPDGGAGEIGHITVDERGPLCRCG